MTGVFQVTVPLSPRWSPLITGWGAGAWGARVGQPPPPRPPLPGHRGIFSPWGGRGSSCEVSPSILVTPGQGCSPHFMDEEADILKAMQAGGKWQTIIRVRSLDSEPSSLLPSAPLTLPPPPQWVVSPGHGWVQCPWATCQIELLKP